MTEARGVECYYGDQFICVEDENIQEEVVLTELTIVEIEDYSNINQHENSLEETNLPDENEKIQYIIIKNGKEYELAQLSLESDGEFLKSSENNDEIEERSDKDEEVYHPLTDEEIDEENYTTNETGNSFLSEENSNDSENSFFQEDYDEDEDEDEKEEQKSNCLLCVKSNEETFFENTENNNVIAHSFKLKSPRKVKSKFTCAKCGRDFKKVNHLTIHMKTHKRDRLFKCDKCDLSFLFQVHLNVHSWKHFNEKI